VQLGYRITSRFAGNVATTPVVPKEEIQEMIRKTILAEMRAEMRVVRAAEVKKAPEMRAEMRAERAAEVKKAPVISQEVVETECLAGDVLGGKPSGRTSMDLIEIMD